jgi:hypothetical protein
MYKINNPLQAAGICSGMQSWFGIQKSISIIHYVSRLTKKNHTSTSIYAKDMTKFNPTQHKNSRY